jgi:GR25 family glycosyltransferase involved in LPS biosynthesis
MENIFNKFDKIFCINLEERTDRWQECILNFEKHNITNYERIDAVKIKEQIDPKRKGQIGCCLSYAKTIEQAIKENLNQFLILEDDFYFSYQKDILNIKLTQSFNDLPNNWDLLYLGGTVGNFYGINPIDKFTNNLYKLNCAHTTHSIAVSKNGALKIKDSFSNKTHWYIDLINNYEAIDVFLAKDFQNKNNCFITSDLLCFQKPSYSNIENTTRDYTQWMMQNFTFFKNQIK